MKRSVVPVICALVAGAEVHGQCNINIFVTQSFTCTGQGSLSTLNVTGAWSGGTPPFTVQVPGAAPQVVFSSPVGFSISYPSAPWVVQPLPFTVTDALQCQQTSSAAFPSAVMPIQDGTRIQMVASNCATGLFDVSLVDHPASMYEPLASDLTSYTYTLFKDGQQVATGLLTSVLLMNPARLVFPGLTSGQFTLTLYTPGMNSNTVLCPTVSQFAFTVPNAGDCGVNFRLSAALDGALPSGTLMTDGLRAANLIPIAEPYSALGYTYVGSPNGVVINPALLNVTGNEAIVDWVIVELRSTTTVVAYSKPALLRRDGSIIDNDGNAYLNFPVTAGSYRIAVRHRNHLGVMLNNATALGLDPSVVFIDLKSGGYTTFGTSALVLKGSTWCLWAGNTNGDTEVKYVGANNDRDPILSAIGGSIPTNVVNNVYSTMDVNMDGSIRYVGANNDRDPILQTVGGSVPTATRSQQLP